MARAGKPDELQGLTVYLAAATRKKKSDYFEFLKNNFSFEELEKTVSSPLE